MKLSETVFWLLNTAPHMGQMRGHPEYYEWRSYLLAASRTKGLSEFQEPLAAIVSDAFSTYEPLQHFLDTKSSSISFNTYTLASELAQEMVNENPYAAFVLSLISMAGWASSLGDKLYDQVNGMPYRGWVNIPYSCALASLKIGAFEGAKLLVDDSYQVLMAGKYLDDARLVAGLANYRYLAGKLQEKYEQVHRNLADDLRESCHPGEYNFRAEVGAMLWSLGLVPESQFLKKTANPAVLPTRRLCREIVRLSLECIPRDPLIQYIWLELKDRLPFNIREHEALFNKINLRYNQLLLDDFYDESPSQLYAKSLIGWFKGDLSDELAGLYLNTYRNVFRLLNAGTPNLSGTIYLRMTELAHILAKERGWLSAEMNEANESEFYYSLAKTGAKVTELSDIHPEWPQIGSRANGIWFTINERDFYDTQHPSQHAMESIEKVFDIGETFRSGVLTYWLKVSPPLPSASERSVLTSFLQEEKELLEYIRGAYFLSIYPLLPRHYQRYSVHMEHFTERKEHPERFRLSPENGRKQYSDMTEELRALFLKMQETAPEYAQNRLKTRAELKDVINSLNNHASP